MNKQIIQLCLIDEDIYNTVRYNTGEAFAESYLGNDHDAATIVMTHPAYWAWWNNQFELTNEKFLKQYGNARLDDKKFFDLWCKAHAPEAVIAFPGQYVIEKAMSHVWDEVTKVYAVKTRRA